MSMTTDTDRFFESDAAYAERQRKIAKKQELLLNKNQEGASHGSLVFQSKDSKIMALQVIDSDDCGDFRVAFATSSGFLVIVKGHKVLLEKKIHNAPVTCLTLCNGIIYSGSWDKSIRMYDLSSGESALIKDAHGDFVKTLAVSSGIMISGGADKIIRLWQQQQHCTNNEWRVTDALRKHTRPIEKVLFLSNNEFVSAGSDMKIYLWNITTTMATATCQRSLAQHETSVYALCPLHCNDDGLFLVSGSADKSLQITNVATGLVVLCIKDFEDWIKAMCLFREDLILVVGLANEKIYVIDLNQFDDFQQQQQQQQQTIASFKDITIKSAIDSHADSISDLQVIAAGAYNDYRFISCALDGNAFFWDARVSTPVEKQITNVAAASAYEHMTAEEEAELAELMMD